MSTITFNCRNFMNCNPEVSLNVWQTIKANPASHMVALAAGLGIALILIIVICTCKWWIKRRSKPLRQGASTPYLPVVSPPPHMGRIETPVIWEDQYTSQSYPGSHIPRTPCQKTYPLYRQYQAGRIETL